MPNPRRRRSRTQGEDAATTPAPVEPAPVEPAPADGTAAEQAPAQATPEAAVATDLAGAEEPAGWFREGPLEGAAPAVEAGEHGFGTAEPGSVAAEPGSVAGDDTSATPGDEPVTVDLAGDALVRERDRPVVTAAPLAQPPPRHGRLRGVAIGVITVVAVGAVGFVAGLMLPTVLPGPGIGATQAPSSPAASATPAASPTPAPSPTATPTPAPTTVASATPGPSATQVVYVVRAGDQLALIAARYGVTVAAIQAANNIKDPNLIRVGQSLVIPAPASPRPASPSP